MTIEEVNAEIAKLEKKIEYLKSLKRTLQGHDVFEEEKEKWISNVRFSIDTLRAFNSDKISKAVEKVPHYEMRSFIYGGYRLYKNGITDRELKHGFRVMLGPVIKSVTHGRCSGIMNKETREYQLTDEEVRKIKIRLNKRIDEWCNKWNSVMEGNENERN